MKINKSLLDQNDILDYTKEVYSTSETLTNKVWIDGKPIYRKCVSTTSGNANVDTSIMTISDVGNIVSLDGTLINSIGSCVSLNYSFGTHYGCLYYSSGSVYCIVSNAAYSGQPLFVVAEYTKTS